MEFVFAKSSNSGTDSDVLFGERNFLTGFPAVVREGVISVVVEIPAGTNQKWEVSADGSSIHWELRDSVPRVVQYLPYPGNYGMVPSTLLPASNGGDGDPLDVIVLGPSVPRGSVVEARPVAVLRLIDQDEKDDKILAVPLSGPLSDITDLASLNCNYPGISDSVRIWFTRYKGAKTRSKGYDNADAAWQLIDEAAHAFELKNVARAE